MSALQAHREHYRAKWRLLAQGMVACAARPEMDPAGLGQLVAEQPARHWITPTDDRAEARLCEAAAALAGAYARAATVRRRTGWAEPLAALAAALGDLLDETEPRPRPGAPLRLWWAGDTDEGES